MAEIKEKEMFMNPYVIQMDKFADSLVHLSSTFLTLEKYKGTFSKDEIDEMFLRVTGKVCENCEQKAQCLGEKRVHTYQMMYEILCTAEQYGAELNVELKRKLQKRCQMAPRFLRESLETFENAKQILMWNNRMVQNREGYVGQLASFAKMIQYTTRELDAGIFRDDHLEKRLKTQLKKSGIRMLSSVFYMTPQGKYEIHLTVKTSKGRLASTKEIAALVGKCVGRDLLPEQGERPVIGEDYCTVAFVESARYHTLQGVAKIGKGCEKISGDTFLMADLPGGKKGIALSDGMGSGEEAFRESAMVVEMLEELLEAGFPVDTAVQMMNTALVIGREEIRFSTLDISLFDLYNGTCEFVKAGAAATYIKRQDTVEKISSSTLPIGVLQEIEIESQVRELHSGDYVIMLTDGVLDALPVNEQDTLLTTFIQDSRIVNPKELAHHILGQVLEWSGEVPVDDMTILVVGIWKR
ncbi:MAG: SpoIIE family protein phosphatase [Dorea sp.]|nr:SpoIIE family protein phosphatase [Dorea sp.]MDY2813471.1 SpoIIE family protein phosphatase [Dorea sp.]